MARNSLYSFPLKREKRMKMIAAFAAWNDRLAPVFDVTENVLILEIENGRIVRETRRALAGEQPEEKIRALIQTGAEILVCGAISRYMHDRLAAAGIRVVPFIAGKLTEIIPAWIRGDFDRTLFAMPGCGGGKGRQCRNGYFSEGGAADRGWRQGRRGTADPGRSRSGGGMGRGGGACVCPQCGLTEPHEYGVRRIERTCPKCGAVMARQ